MAQKNRGALATDIVNAQADNASKITTYLPTNGNRAIKASDHRLVDDNFNTWLQTLTTHINDSKFNIISDNSDIIIQGNTNLFATPANLLAWIENPVYVTTDNLNEGTANLYYTDARADARINTLRPEQAGIANLGLTVSASYNQGELQSISNKVDAILTALRGANVIA
jgi:hypothetical protein